MTRIGSALLLAVVAVILASFFGTTEAFVPRAVTTGRLPATTTTFAKKQKEDLSYLETRDMTREEMIEFNKQAEKTMNQELALMTGFSLAISLPILYLCWVAFFSD